MKLKIAFIMLRDFLFVVCGIVWWYIGYKVLVFFGVETSTAACWPILTLLVAGILYTVFLYIGDWVRSAKKRAEKIITLHEPYEGNNRLIKSNMR